MSLGHVGLEADGHTELGAGSRVVANPVAQLRAQVVMSIGVSGVEADGRSVRFHGLTELPSAAQIDAESNV